MSPNKSHHHGDLREALIRAGLELLAEHGTEGLTLRRAAAKAGVTHAAPAHHFDGLDGLRSAISERGFEQLLEALECASAEAGSDDYQRLLDSNLAYVKFASENSALFQLMFTQVKIGTDSLKTMAGKSYALLQDNCSRMKHGYDPVAFEFAIWAMTHGYAALDMANRRPRHGAIIAPDFDELMRTLIAPPTAAE